MTETFTLVHLSDVHLGPITGFYPRYWNIKRGLGLLNWQRGRRRVHQRSVADRIAADVLAQAPDHIAVTGDLANIGLPQEYVQGLRWLEALGDPEKVSLVPGNHDIYTGRLNGESCLETWAPYMRGDGVSGTPPSPVQFPYVRIRGPVGLVGLCSAVPTPPFVAAGRLGDTQIATLASSLEGLKAAGLVRVVLIHHPALPGLAPPRRALEDAAALAEVLGRCGAELVLHGHNHREMLTRHMPSVAGVAGRGIPVLGVASASAGVVHKSEPLARYHVIRIRRTEAGPQILCETRGLAEPGGEVVSLAQQDLSASLR
jgi:3',5'-cyclic AMP phosphodiesterase CpdA